MRADILHTQEVAAYTRYIAEGEGLSQHRIDLLECAAWLHDIGCPCSRQKHGNSLPPNQQKLGAELSALLLEQHPELPLCEEERQWLIEVVGTHHQYPDALRLDYLPLYEADMLVNLLDGYYPRDKAPLMYKSKVKTATGKELFQILLGLTDSNL